MKSVRDVPAEAISQAIKTIEAERKRLSAEKARAEQKIRLAKERLTEITSADQRLARKLSLLTNAKFIRACVADSVVAYREKMLALKIRAADRTISVAEHEDAVKQLQLARERLQSACPHPLVIYTEGYGGSYAYDHDDAYRGDHGCVVCGKIAVDSDYNGANAVMPNDNRRLKRRLYDEYENRSGDYRDKLHNRLADYEALATVGEVIDTYFRAKPLENLKKLLTGE